MTRSRDFPYYDRSKVRPRRRVPGPSWRADTGRRSQRRHCRDYVHVRSVHTTTCFCASKPQFRRWRAATRSAGRGHQGALGGSVRDHTQRPRELVPSESHYLVAATGKRWYWSGDLSDRCRRRGFSSRGSSSRPGIDVRDSPGCLVGRHRWRADAARRPSGACDLD